MSDRAIRRAAERAAKKAAAKAAKANQAHTVGEAAKTMTASANNITPTWDSWDGWDNDDPPPPYSPSENGDEQESQTKNTRPISDAKLAANRQNAQQSTGAKSQTGKDKSKMNALRNALTGQTVLLPTDDAVAYQAFIDSINKQWSPMDDQEKRLTQLISDTEWRIHRVAALETNIFAVGRIEQPLEQFSESEGVLQAKLHLIYGKELKNLALQERRLFNQHKSLTEKLEQLQQDRIEKAKQAEQALKDEREAIVTRAAKISANCYKLNKPFRPADFGFDFSYAEYDHYWNLQDAQYELTEEVLDFHKVIEAYRNSKKVA
jgi:hypothetical protein